MQIYFEDHSYTIDPLRINTRLKDQEDRSPVTEVMEFISNWYNDDDTMVVHTSGSTGTPKAIRLSKAHMLSSARRTLDELKIKDRQVLWLCVPVAYIAGKMMIVRALAGHHDLVISRPSTQLSIPDAGRIALTAMVPSQVTSLLSAPGEIRSLESRVDHLLVGGAGLSPVPEEQIALLHSVRIWHTYGMTETISHVALRALNGPERQTAFNPLKGVTITTNEQGCLIIDDHVLKLKKLVTNDLVVIQPNGMFTIEGRADLIINSGGIKINPLMIEKKLHDAGFPDFFITGLADSMLGQRAVLVIEGGHQATKQVCQYWKMIDQRLTGHEVPREIIFIAEFARNAQNKLKRAATCLHIITSSTYSK